MALFEKLKARSSRHVLLFGLGIDIAFLIASILYLHIDFFPILRFFYVERDNGFAEIFQYLKFSLIIFFLASLANFKKSQLLGAWALLFSILLLDDSLQLHERLGKALSQGLSIPGMYYLRSVDYGELMIYALWGIIAVTALMTTAWVDRLPLARRVSRGLLLSLAGLVCFGGVVDIIHVFAQNYFQLSRYYADWLGVVEDGGEMFVISVTVWFLYRLYLQVRHPGYREAASVEYLAKTESTVEPLAKPRRGHK